MKKITGVITASILALFLLASCGGGTVTNEVEKEPEKEVKSEKIDNGGKYIAVAQTVSDIWSFDSEDSFELQSDGKAVWTAYGHDYEATWEEADGNIKFNTEIGEKTAEPYGDNGAYIVKDSDTSYEIFAKEGSEAADPTLYMPDNYKTMVGTWKTDAVEDVLGEDKSDEVPADALTVEINADQTAHVVYNGEDLGVNDWVMMTDWGGISSEDPKFTISWTIKDDGVTFDFVKDSKLYYFHGVKQ